MKHVIYFLTSIFLLVTGAAAQTGSRVITTAVPFLEIPPSSVGLGMGNTGAATLSDESLFYNPAKMLSGDYTQKVSLSYMPWLSDVAPDMNLASVNYLTRNESGNHGFGFNLTYFTEGNILLRDNNGTTLSTQKTNEFAFSGTYCLALSYSSALAVSFRGIYSGLASMFGTPDNPSYTLKPAFDVATDISYYKSFELDFSHKIMVGANLSNLGPKMSYDQGADGKVFLPTTLRLGVGYNDEVNEDNGFTVGLDLSKLLVPTPPIYDNSGTIIKGKNPDRGVLNALFTSFSDAPGGLSEELKEIYATVGGEYRFQNIFSFRAGLSYEDPTKGDRKFVSLGVGCRGTVYDQQLQFNMSYLVPFGNSTVTSPLRNSVGLTLIYFIGESGSNER